MLLVALLAPMAFCNLRAQVRPNNSISDASEDGGAAGEAGAFLPYLNPEVGNAFQEFQVRGSEGSYTCISSGVLELCSECRNEVPHFGAWARCGPGCSFKACSWSCWSARKHFPCLRVGLPLRGVGLSEFEEHSNLAWGLVASGSNPFISKKSGLAVFSDEALSLIHR